MKIDIKKLTKTIIAQTNRINVGQVYFLSCFRHEEGCNVKVLSKSTERVMNGFPVGLEVQVLSQINIRESDKSYYAVGSVHTVNATNLYVDRRDASPQVKFGGLHLRQSVVLE